MAVSVAPPELTGEAATIVGAWSTAFKAAADKRGIKKNLVIALLSKNLDVVWSDKLEPSPPFLNKIMVSKARSFHAGKTMVSPGACETMCCHFCPWMCGCTNQMPVQGVIAFDMPGSDAAFLVVAGAPQGSTDLAIANELAGAAKGGAPDVASIDR